MSTSSSQSHQHVLVGALLGGAVALLLLYEGASTIEFRVVVFPLALLGAWLGWRSTPEAKRHYLRVRHEAAERTHVVKQDTVHARAETELKKAQHERSRVHVTLGRGDELETGVHRNKVIGLDVEEGELRGRLDEQKLSALDRLLRQFGLERRISAARRPDLDELERAYVQGLDAVIDVMPRRTEMIEEIRARTDLDEASKEALVASVNDATLAILERRRERETVKENPRP